MEYVYLLWIEGAKKKGRILRPNEQFRRVKEHRCRTGTGGCTARKKEQGCASRAEIFKHK